MRIRFTRLPLAVEITLLLAVKLALIMVLAKTFFAHPQAKHMQMPVASVEQRLLAPPSSLPPLPSSTPQATIHPSEVSHDSDR